LLSGDTNQVQNAQVAVRAVVSDIEKYAQYQKLVCQGESQSSPKSVRPLLLAANGKKGAERVTEEQIRPGILHQGDG
jgi:hypothetical protein